MVRLLGGIMQECEFFRCRKIRFMYQVCKVLFVLNLKIDVIDTCEM